MLEEKEIPQNDASCHSRLWHDIESLIAQSNVSAQHVPCHSIGIFRICDYSLPVGFESQA